VPYCLLECGNGHSAPTYFSVSMPSLCDSILSLSLPPVHFFISLNAIAGYPPLTAKSGIVDEAYRKIWGVCMHLVTDSLLSRRK